ncbi:hypothetical protein ACOME3_004487 [Neoechinorhynchus agilis]
MKFAAIKQTGAATASDDRKNTKYRVLGRNHYFVPFGVETLGSFLTAAQDLVKQLSNRLRRIIDDPRAGPFLLQNISLSRNAVSEGTAIEIMRTLRASPEQGSRLDRDRVVDMNRSYLQMSFRKAWFTCTDTGVNCK